MMMIEHGLKWLTWKYPSELLLPSENVKRPWPQILPALNSGDDDDCVDYGDDNFHEYDDC